MDQLRFKINKINTYKFETSDFTDTSIDKVRLETKIDFKKIESHIIEIVVQSKFYRGDIKNEIINISAGITYDIHPEDFAEFIQNDGTIIIPQNLAIYLSGLVVGSTRGILSVRTENTKFSQFIIPPTTLDSTIPSDIKIT